MNEISDALTFALVALLVLIAFGLPFRPPNTCKTCGAPMARRHLVQHYLDHHAQEHSDV